MINGLGVLGWGVGGIEAEAAMLGQPLYMLLPQVVGVRLTGALEPGVTATDLVLTLTQLLRKHGVVEKIVEFTGPGAGVPLAPDRAVVANMAPEYGATAGFFPVDASHARLPAAHRPRRSIGGPGGALRQGADALPGEERSRAALQRRDRTRHVLRRALRGGSAAPPGPSPAGDVKRAFFDAMTKRLQEGDRGHAAAWASTSFRADDTFAKPTE